MEPSLEKAIALPTRKTFREIYDDVDSEYYFPYNRYRFAELQKIKSDLYSITCMLAETTLELRSTLGGYTDFGLHPNTPMFLQEHMGRLLKNIAEAIIQDNPMFFDQRMLELYTVLLFSIPFEIYHDPKNTSKIFLRILNLQHSLFTTYELITYYLKDNVVVWNQFAAIVGDVSYTPLPRIQRYVPFLKKYEIENKIEEPLNDLDFGGFGGEVMISQILQNIERGKK
jgi:hypothetical protein